MKKHVFSIVVLALLTVLACKETATADQSESEDKTTAADETEAPDYATFDKSAAVLSSFLQAHCDEDLEALTAMLSDTLKWSPPFYNGNKWLGKEDFLPVLKNYHDGFEDIRYTAGITLADTTGSGVFAGSVFPKDVATSDPSTIRQYGTWSAKHTETGKMIGVKWYAIGSVNDDGKIVMWTEYFDANGIAVQIAEE